MKSFTRLFAVIALLFGVSAFAQDFSAVGSHSLQADIFAAGNEATNDKAVNGQAYLTGFQWNLGTLGSVYADGGILRLNAPTIFGLPTSQLNSALNLPGFVTGYANGVKLGKVSVVGFGQYAYFRGNVGVNGTEDPQANADFSSEAYTVGAEGKYAVNRAVDVFARYAHSVSTMRAVVYSGDTYLGDISATGHNNTEAVGTYLHVNDRTTVLAAVTYSQPVESGGSNGVGAAVGLTVKL